MEPGMRKSETPEVKFVRPLSNVLFLARHTRAFQPQPVPEIQVSRETPMPLPGAFHA
jgi:hypothetical protein